MAEGLLGEIGAEREGADHLAVLNVTAKGVEKKRRFLGDWAADGGIEKLRVIRRLNYRERAASIEGAVIPIGEEVSMELAEAGFGGDFDSPIAELVVLRRKRVLVDADFQDRFLATNCRPLSRSPLSHPHQLHRETGPRARRCRQGRRGGSVGPLL